VKPLREDRLARRTKTASIRHTSTLWLQANGATFYGRL
jgi:hypothetical protein